jgi:3-oxoacyl-[acyl-carrier protein] reductase
MITLIGKVALITGGSRGIGAATARYFAAAGADVAITYHKNARSAETIVDEIISSGGTGIAVKADLSDPAAADDVVRTVLRDFGRIDILVTSAGIWTPGQIGAMPARVWRETIDLNLTGTYAICNSVVPVMKKQHGGKIITIASTAGQRGEAGYSHYAASKGGVIAFTKSLAAELGPSGINVNCVAPGWVLTDMSRKTLANKRYMQELVKTLPLGYVPGPDEIAGPVLFLASDLASNITGEILNVNGDGVLCG